jgi:glycosyltransferase involved in cell wall biosynthesis
LRILLANHTGSWSGAEVSLMRVLEGLRRDHDVAVACPHEGRLREAVERTGTDWLDLPDVDVSLRPHPIHTPVGLWQLRSAGVALARASRRWRAHVIHANTPRSGLTGALAQRMGAAPMVVRAHEHLPPSPIGRASRAAIVRSARAVAAVSDFTAERFNEGLPEPVATRVYNSVDLVGLEGSRRHPAPLREELGLAPDSLLVGQVAQITPWKRQHVAIRAFAGIRAAGVDAHLVIVGTVVFGGKRVRHDNHAYQAELEQLVRELGLADAVHFLGQRDDSAQVLAALDLSMLPSWEEPFGLVTVESMAAGTPPLVSINGAGPELVEHGVTGMLVEPERPEAWTAAACELLTEPDRLRRMGERGPAAAAGFNDAAHASEMVVLYERAAARAAARPRRSSRLAPRRA